MPVFAPVTKANLPVESGTVERPTSLRLLGIGVSCGVYNNEAKGQPSVLPALEEAIRAF